MVFNSKIIPPSHLYIVKIERKIKETGRFVISLKMDFHLLFALFPSPRKKMVNLCINRFKFSNNYPKALQCACNGGFISTSLCCNVFAVRLEQSQSNINLFGKYGGTEI